MSKHSTTLQNPTAKYDETVSKRDSDVLSIGKNSMNPSSDLFGWAILFATFFGPICAVVITRLNDDWREHKARQKAIFRTLMSTRASRLSADAIQALNLIEIDFSRNENVIKAWHDYFAHLNIESPIEQDRAQEFFERRNRLYVLLLDRMAKAVGYKLEQMSILDGGYYPTGAVQIEAENQAVRQLFASISRGERTLPVTIENLPKQ